MTQQTTATASDFLANLQDLIRSMQAAGMVLPTFVMLKNKHEALKIIQQLAAFDRISVIHDVQSGVIHSFLLMGIEFCWPADPELANVIEVIETRQGAS